MAKLGGIQSAASIKPSQQTLSYLIKKGEVNVAT